MDQAEQPGSWRSACRGMGDRLDHSGRRRSSSQCRGTSARAFAAGSGADRSDPPGPGPASGSISSTDRRRAARRRFEAGSRRPRSDGRSGRVVRDRADCRRRSRRRGPRATPTARATSRRSSPMPGRRRPRPVTARSSQSRTTGARRGAHEVVGSPAWPPASPRWAERRADSGSRSVKKCRATRRAAGTPLRSRPA